MAFSLLIKIRTYVALGLGNIAHVIGYRLSVRFGINRVLRLSAKLPAGPYLGPASAPLLSVLGGAYGLNSIRLFSRWPVPLGVTPPDWLANPLNDQRLSSPHRPWWQIPDFDPLVGDIKLIWELSRMDWVLAMAQRVRLAEAGALDQMNAWLADWCQHNPPYFGPNWKCGQEASIRVMHLACAALVLGQAHDTLPGLRDLVALHLQRIAPTVQYAMAQDNNHGTSEAAALFIGGSWLAALGDARGARWAATGRAMLENRANRLIGEQGTFSQYSLNYHRVMLDTFSIAECWRLHLALPAFTTLWQAKALAAAQWLYTLTDPNTGDGPNVGANDGARLLQLTDTPYRDYRPSVQLAMALFAGQRAYDGPGTWNHPLQWLGVGMPARTAPPQTSLQADDGGFMVLRWAGAMALLRYPRFRFRPSQADVLHVDLWVAGQNYLRDAGTYSYNTDPQWPNYFGGVAGHNTVQFDGRDQMPRLSRFLLGDWLQTEGLAPLTTDSTGVQAGAGYCDRAGAQHHRHVRLEDGTLTVCDRLQGFARKAVLRWRLAPGDWQVQSFPGVLDDQCRSISNGQGHRLSVTSDGPIVRCEIVPGWESLHYLEKTAVPVLELEVHQACTLTSVYQWAA